MTTSSQLNKSINLNAAHAQLSPQQVAALGSIIKKTSKTGKGTVTFYPATYGWQRIQNFYHQAHSAPQRGAATLVKPLAASLAIKTKTALTPAKALIAHKVAIRCALGHMAVIAPTGRAALIESLLGYVEQHGIVGLESLVLSVAIYEKSKGDPTSYGRAVTAWTKNGTQPALEMVPVMDFNKMTIGVLSSSDITALQPGGKSAAAFNATDVSQQIFSFLDMGAAADGSDGCKQTATAVGSAAGAVIGGVAGFVTGAIAGAAGGTVTLPVVGTVGLGAAAAYAGAAAGFLAGGSGGKDIGDAVGPVVCGWVSDDSAPASDAGAGVGGAAGAGGMSGGTSAPEEGGTGTSDTTGGGTSGGYSSSDTNAAGGGGSQDSTSTSGGTSASGSGGSSDDTSGGTSGGDDNSGGNSSGYPNPEDYPNPDDTNGFSITSATLLSTYNSASWMGATSANGAISLSKMPCFNYANGQITIQNSTSGMNTATVSASLSSHLAQFQQGLNATAFANMANTAMTNISAGAASHVATGATGDAAPVAT